MDETQKEVNAHLCDTCKFEFPTCAANASNVTFAHDLAGARPNDDRIVRCAEYVER
jgi:hypothetical protein